MREAPKIEAKKNAAYELSQAFLDGVFAAPEFEAIFDRGTAVAVAMLRYVIREKVDPFAYLQFVREFVDQCVVMLDTEEENATWH